MSIVRAPALLLAFCALVGALKNAWPTTAQEACTALSACDRGPGREQPWCDGKLSFSERAADLVARIPVALYPHLLSDVEHEEHVSGEICGRNAVPSLGIHPREWWNEALHGLSSNTEFPLSNIQEVPATVFPQVILTASTFNSTLFWRLGRGIGREARATWNFRRGLTYLTFWAPNINIFRDPRWGRGQETPGEDPFLTAQYAVNFVRGLQGDKEVEIGTRRNEEETTFVESDRRSNFSEVLASAEQFGVGRGPTTEEEDGPPTFLLASACLKHFFAYSLETYHGMDRFHFNAQVSSQDLEETYLPAFEAGVRLGRASGVMCSYNSVNGVPSCANEEFTKQKLKDEWGFQVEGV